MGNRQRCLKQCITGVPEGDKEAERMNLILKIQYKKSFREKISKDLNLHVKRTHQVPEKEMTSNNELQYNS